MLNSCKSLFLFLRKRRGEDDLRVRRLRRRETDQEALAGLDDALASRNLLILIPRLPVRRGVLVAPNVTIKVIRLIAVKNRCAGLEELNVIGTGFRRTLNRQLGQINIKRERIDDNLIGIDAGNFNGLAVALLDFTRVGDGRICRLGSRKTGDEAEGIRNLEVFRDFLILIPRLPVRRSVLVAPNVTVKVIRLIAVKNRCAGLEELNVVGAGFRRALNLDVVQIVERLAGVGERRTREGERLIARNTLIADKVRE